MNKVKRDTAQCPFDKTRLFDLVGDSVENGYIEIKCRRCKDFIKLPVKKILEFFNNK